MTAVTIADILTTPVATVTPDTKVQEALSMMREQGVSSLVVLDDGQRPIGIFTERDLVRLESIHGNVPVKSPGAIMSEPAHTVPVDMSLPEALRIMNQARILHLVAVDDRGSIVGLITPHDIVKQLYDSRQEKARLHAMLSALVHGSSDAIFIKDQAGRYLLGNQALANLLDRPMETIVGADDFALFPPDLAARIQAKDQRIMRLGRSDTFEEPIIIGDRTLPYLTTKGPLIIDGEIQGIFGIARDITEFRRATADLARAQQVANVGSWTYQVTDGRIHWSDQLYRIFGREPGPADLDYDTLKSWIHPQDRSAHDLYFQRMLAMDPKSEIEHLEYRLIRPDGEQRWAQVGLECEFDTSGRPALFFGTIQDITERKRSEAALVESEGRQRLFIEHAPAALAMFDHQMRYLAVSRRWITDYGLENDDILGRSHYQVFPEIPERWRAVHQRALGGEILHSDGERFDRQDGSEQWLQWEVRPWYLPDGATGGIVIFTEDISARVQAESALRESEQRYRSFVENTLEGIYSFETDAPIPIDLPVEEQVRRIYRGRFVACNDAQARMYGYGSANDLLGVTLSQVHGGDDKPENIALLSDWVKARYRIDRAISRQEDNRGAEVWFENSLVGVVENGQLVRIWGSQVDVTERILANRNLEYRLTLEAALSKASSELVQTDDTDLDTSIHKTLETIGRAVGAARGYLFIADPESGALARSHAWCAPGVLPMKERPQYITGAADQEFIDRMAKGEVLRIQDTDPADSALNSGREIMRRTGVVASVNVPILSDGRLSGLIRLDSERPDKTWPDEDIAVLRTLAEVLSSTLARRDTMLRIREHNWFLESLDRISRILTGQQHTTTLLRRLTDLVLELFQADRAWLLHPCDADAPFHRIVMESRVPGIPGLGQGFRFPVSDYGKRLMRAVLGRDRPLIQQTASIADLPEAIRALGIRSEMMTALRPRNASPWVLGIHQCAGGREWSAVEQGLFQAIAERAQLALTSALLLEQVSQSESRLLEAQHIAHLGHWELDIATGEAQWSDQVHRILGTDPGRTVGPAFLSSIVNPADWPAVQASLDAAITEGMGHEMEYRVRSLDGAERWLYCKAQRELDADGQPIRLTGIVQDITERKRAEARLAQSDAEWTQAMDQYDDAIYMADMRLHLVRANRAFYRMIGSEAERCLGRSISELVHPDGEPMPCPVCLAQKEVRETMVTMEPDDPNNPSGLPVEITVKPIQDNKGAAVGTLVSMHDLSHARQTDERLRLSASVFENTAEGVVVTDPDGTIMEINRAFSEILGYGRDEVIGRNPRMWQSGRHDRDFYQSMWLSLKETGRWRGEIWNRRKDGSVFPEWQTVSGVRDGSGRLTHYVSVFSDISQMKQSQEKLDHLAHHDALTDLPNRLLLNERLEQAIRHARRHQTRLALMMLDLDRFKQINDSLGHPVGDDLLRTVATKLLKSVRGDDTVARIGGDEFVLLFEDIQRPESAGITATKLLSVFAKPFQLAHREIQISASLGICLYPQDGTDPATLLRNADAAMYRAKDEGRNNYQFYTEQLTRDVLERLLMENNLRRSLELGQLYLLYQPQVALQTGRIVGVEALIRWRHPDLGLVSPLKFIPLAEETGLIHPIGDWVLYTACRQGAAWLEQGLEFGRMAVNISGPQIQRGQLVDVVSHALERSGLPASRLELEMTEGFIMLQAESTIAQLDALRALGITLAIDDFGTGYSSLSYLKKLPVHKLKIDQSFVRDIPNDPNDMAICNAVIALGISLGMTVIAEGVETQEQAAFLKNAECQEAQGYRYSKPIPPTEVEALIRAQSA